MSFKAALSYPEPKNIFEIELSLGKGWGYR